MKYHRILFWAFLAVYLATAALTLYGLQAAWHGRLDDLPYLKVLVPAFLLETAAAILYLFKMSLRAVPPHAAVRSLLSLTVDTLAAHQPTLHPRMSFLLLDTKSMQLRMLVQDKRDYSDSRLEVDVAGGCEEGFVVCKSVHTPGVVAQDLPRTHPRKYTDLGYAVPADLRSVVATQVRPSAPGPLGVLALDAQLTLGEWSLTAAQRTGILMRARNAIEEVLGDMTARDLT